MSLCNDVYEPECEGETCRHWGKCEFSKRVIEEEGYDRAAEKRTEAKE